MATPIGIPDEWDDNDLILFEEFCELIRTPQRTVRDWRRRGVGPRWTRFQGVGRLYITVAEARRFLASATVTRGTFVPMAERRDIPVYLSLEEAADACRSR